MALTALSQGRLLDRRLDAIVTPPGLFRLGLALAVVCSHVSAFDIGRLAVVLFFFLSGYWVTAIWTKKFGYRTVGKFYLSRAWRVLPLYWLVMLIAAWLRHHHLGLTSFTLLGLASTGDDPTGVAWSLDIEMQFYLLFPLIAFASAKLPRLALAILTIGLAAAGWGIEASFHITTFLKYLPVFMAGVVSFQSDVTPRLKTASLSIGAFALMTVVTAWTPFLLKGQPTPFDHDLWAMIWMAPLIPYVLRSLKVASVPADRDMGNLSYPLYLVHYWLITVVMQAFPEHAWAKWAGVCAAIIGALILYRFVDRPVDAWRVAATERRTAKTG
jgi:peptidoglycan/LPS O-acetylase OafA/YrhL